MRHTNLHRSKNAKSWLLCAKGKRCLYIVQFFTLPLFLLQHFVGFPSFFIIIIIYYFCVVFSFPLNIESFFFCILFICSPGFVLLSLGLCTNKVYNRDLNRRPIAERLGWFIHISSSLHCMALIRAPFIDNVYSE